MKSARLFIGLLILVGAVGVLVNGAPIFSRFLYLGVLLSFVGWAWTRLTIRSLRVTRHARMSRATVGDVFEENFELVNQGLLIVPWIEVKNESPIPFASGSRLLTNVTSKQKISYLARTWLTRRGGFSLGPTAISTGDPFGLFRVTKRIPAEQSLIVFPMLVAIPSFFMPPGLLPGGQVIRRKSADVTPHASGLREYAYGDAMKRIHWPSSVRRGQLMVKEFEQDPQAEVWLFLDAQKNVHAEKPQEQEEVPVDALFLSRKRAFRLPPSTLEYAVTITASLARYFLQQRRAVGLLSSGRAFTVLSADRSDRQEAKILETLAFVEAEGNVSLAGLVAAQAGQLPQGSNAILITPSVRPDVLAAVDDLARRYLRPLVILLVAETFGGARGSDKLIRSLAERNVPVCPIDCDADLGAALSSFAAQTTLDIRTWQRPPLSHLT